jgi:hypothetical protein
MQCGAPQRLATSISVPVKFALYIINKSAVHIIYELSKLNSKQISRRSCLFHTFRRGRWMSMFAGRGKFNMSVAERSLLADTSCIIYAYMHPPLDLRKG